MYLYLVQRSILSTLGDKILRKRTLILWWNTFVLKGINMVQYKTTICQGSCPKFNNSISVMFKWGFSRNSGLVAIPLAFWLCLSYCNDCHMVELKWDVVVAVWQSLLYKTTGIRESRTTDGEFVALLIVAFLLS